MICAAPATSTSTLKLVAVADDVVLRQFLRDTLEDQCGHQVVGEGVTGTDMIRTVLALEPDVVVFDVSLPCCNGLEALRQIYKERPTAAVALTNERDQDLVRKCLTEYYLTYLVKPVEPQHLEPAVMVAHARFDLFSQLTAENATLRQTLQNRKIIERAKGVLMKRYSWTEADAFRRLQRGAMNRRTTMVRLAQVVLDGGLIEL
jgi:response regulator NasT